MKFSPWARAKISCPYSANEAYNRVLPVVEPRESLLSKYLNSFVANPLADRRYTGTVHRGGFLLRGNRLLERGIWRSSLAVVRGKIHSGVSGCVVEIELRPPWLLALATVLALLWTPFVVYMMLTVQTPAVIFQGTLLLMPPAGIAVVAAKQCLDVSRDHDFFLKLFQTGPSAGSAGSEAHHIQGGAARGY